MIFLGQATYGFEAKEFMNPTLQTDRNLELNEGVIAYWIKATRRAW